MNTSNSCSVYAIFIESHIIVGCDTKNEAFDILNMLIDYKTNGEVSFYGELSKLQEAFIANGVTFKNFNDQIPWKIINMLIKPYGLSVGR